MEIDIYDFDKTVIPFDSGTRFTLYCFLHYPWCFVLLPVIAAAFLLMTLKVISFTQFKRICFSYYPMIPKKRAVKRFWDKHEKEVHPWFYTRSRYSVVISASPDFLLGEIQKRLGFEMLICTRHNKKTGRIIGENCRGEEKVRRLEEAFGETFFKVIDVYSDSLKFDRPIFSLASGKCYHIVDGKKLAFDYHDKF